MTERALTSARQTAGVSRRPALLLPTMSGARNSFLRMAAAALMLPAIAISAPSVEAQAPAGFAVHESPRPLPEIQFEDGQGEAMRLADFRGKVVLLNIWATWCAPCRREMPTLERLQAELGGPDFEVVALSIDRKGLPVVKEFYDELGLQELGMYVDTSAKASRELNALGVPTTLLIDREGNEIGRLLGPAEWDSPEMVDFIRGQIQQPSKASLGPAAHEQLASDEVRRPGAGLGEPLPSSDWKEPPHAQQGDMT
jgi:thiol-disulfide isomerase/thioredoxin